jgi:hypothetical protein
MLAERGAKIVLGARGMDRLEVSLAWQVYDYEDDSADDPASSRLFKFRGSMIGGVASYCKPPRDCNRRDRERSQHNNGDRNTGARRACRCRSRPAAIAAS